MTPEQKAREEVDRHLAAAGWLVQSHKAMDIWGSLLTKDGDDLEVHYRHVLEKLGKKRGMLGKVFKKARQDIQNPATLKRLIVDLIEPETWMLLEADIKGDIYEGLLAKSAAESPKGAGHSERIALSL